MTPSPDDLKRLREAVNAATRDGYAAVYWATSDIEALLNAIEAQRAEVLEEAAKYFDKSAYDYGVCAAFSKDISERQNFKNAQLRDKEVAEQIRALKAAKE